MATFFDERRGWAIGDPGLVKRRGWMSGAALALMFLGLLARLWYLQIVKGNEFLAQAQHNRTRSVPLLAPRGLVLDRNGMSAKGGVVLATSRAQHSVAVVPAALPSEKTAPDQRAAVLGTLGFLLHTNPAAIEAQLAEARRKGAHDYDPVRVLEDADLKTLTLVEENKARLGQAILVTDDIARVYPQKSLAAHVMGYTGIVTEEDIDKAAAQSGQDPNARQLAYDDMIGKSGIEREYDKELSGTPGSEEYEVDAKLRPVRKRGTIAQKPGNTLVLTIDAKMQRAAEDALAAARNSGAVVAVDVQNGEVLALASRPGFDPNIFSLPPESFRPAYAALLKDDKHPLINRAVTSRFPPGSTFKMVTASAGLQHGTITPGTVYNCAGGLRMGRFFGCWQTHGSVNLMDALAKSCDVYFYQTALALGNPEGSGPSYLATVARGFGLGSPTGIDLPIDGAGLIPDPAWRAKINAGNPSLARWFPGNTLNMAIGQGDVLATPLQMALVTAAVANGGTLWQPHLLKAVKSPEGKILRTFTPKGKNVGIETRYLDLVRAGMRAVVTSGTGKPVALPNVEVAGKTGSAEDDHHGLPHAWFVCFAPYDKPRIAIACIVENSGHGSENAAPVAKQILQAMFPAPKTAGPLVAARSMAR